MNRTAYYNFIDEKLHVLAHRVSTNGKLNMLHLNIHSENFYLHFFNLLYDYELENLNQSQQNIEAIDLVDHTNKIIVQVSSTNTKQKIELALAKDIIKGHSSYTFKFISIAKDASKLKKMVFNNPHLISFNPAEDIYDIASILNTVLNAEIDKQKRIYRFIQKELVNEVNIVKLDTNLAAVINILAKEKWNETNKLENINSFEIEQKIVYNDLDLAKTTIETYCLYYARVDATYSEFDAQGDNKSISVLATINREYIKLKHTQNSDDIFFFVIEAIKNKIINSANFYQIPLDELDLCIDILVVDAFIRCKIFENPKGYSYATS